jgi:hypothetical protein
MNLSFLSSQGSPGAAVLNVGIVGGVATAGVHYFLGKSWLVSALYVGAAYVALIYVTKAANYGRPIAGAKLAG